MTRGNKRVNRGRDTGEELGCVTKYTMDDAHLERDARPDSIKVEIGQQLEHEVENERNVISSEHGPHATILSSHNGQRGRSAWDSESNTIFISTGAQKHSKHKLSIFSEDSFERYTITMPCIKFWEFQ